MNQSEGYKYVIKGWEFNKYDFKRKFIVSILFKLYIDKTLGECPIIMGSVQLRPLHYITSNLQLQHQALITDEHEDEKYTYYNVTDQKRNIAINIY